MQLTTKQVAETFGVTTRTVHNWLNEGVPVLRNGGRAGNKFPLAELIQWWVERQVRANAEDGVLDYTAERARLTFHQANIAEMDAEKQRGNLWPMETVQLLLQRIIGNGRSKLLAIPGKFRNRLPDLGDEAYQLQEELIHEACEELAEDKLPGGIRGSLERYHAHLATAAESDAESVGDAPRRDH